MDKTIAEEIAKAIRLFEEPVNLLTEITKKLDNEEERKKVRRYTGEIMALVTVDLLQLIASEYPELNVYKDYFKDTKS